ncbi:hypothetical protein PO124_13380 [Bacillus licheniformis]|nr:hypothetical protein [Bacillus licheniformis]
MKRHCFCNCPYSFSHCEPSFVLNAPDAGKSPCAKAAVSGDELHELTVGNMVKKGEIIMEFTRFRS